MALWEKAGIPRTAILRAATAAAAEYFGLGGRVGRVAPGQVADLLFLQSNPLDGLAVMESPMAVMVEGRLYDRAALGAGRAEAVKAAASWRYPAHFLRDLLRNPAGFTG
jgi:adenine deaminase